MKHPVKSVKYLFVISMLFLANCSTSVFQWQESAISDINLSLLQPKNAVGPTDSTTLRTLDYTPTDANTVFIKKTGSDVTGTGTQNNPVASVNKAVTLCDAARQRMMILDSETYREKGFEFSGNARGLYAALGEKPVLEMTQNPDFWTIEEKVGETLFHDVQTRSIASLELPNGNIFVAYTDSADNNKGKYIILNRKTWTIEKSETVFNNANTENISACFLPDGNIFIAYRGNLYKGEYLVLDSKFFSIKKTPTIFKNNSINYTTVKLLNNKDIFISYSSGGGKYIIISTTDWSIIKEETIFGGVASNEVELLKDGNLFVVFTDGQCKYLVLEPYSGNIIKQAEILYNNIQGVGAIDSTTLFNKNIFVMFRDYDDNNIGKYLIINPENWEIVKPVYNFYNTRATLWISLLTLKNGNLFIAYDDEDNSRLGKFIVKEFKTEQHIKVTEKTTLNGIKLTSDDSLWLDKFINAENSRLSLNWCEVSGNISSTTNQTCKAVYSNNSLEINNSIIADNDIGIYSESNKVRIIDSIIYGHADNYAVTINGTAVTGRDIIINHTDFFNNYGGLRFTSNSGLEIVKNSIFHQNEEFSVDSASPLTVYYSLYSDVTRNVSYQNCAQGDPLYVSSIEPFNFNLLARKIGSEKDSPGLGLADDGRNAGALDVEY